MSPFSPTIADDSTSMRRLMFVLSAPGSILIGDVVVQVSPLSAEESQLILTASSKSGMANKVQDNSVLIGVSSLLKTTRTDGHETKKGV